MELKSPKAKKKTTSKLVSWKKLFSTPILILLLLGSTSCDIDSDTDVDTDVRHTDKRIDRQVLSDIRYLRRNLNKDVLNFVMKDVLIDGEVENRIHFNGITAKETFVGANGNGLKLRQMTDGGHLIQIIYTPNGAIQDCEYITDAKTTRNFLKTLRRELKLALDEEAFRITEKRKNVTEDERFYRHFGNMTFRLLTEGEMPPPDIASWLDYDRLKMECFERHEELKYMMENKNKYSEPSLARSRRSFRENFIMPGTKWCGAGQLAKTYNELGQDRNEDRCCRAHDNCRVNIGAFKRRFGLFNYRPYTISHCKCDRRFRACLKLADTSVSNMVGKLFFNVVQTKCFVLKPIKACKQRSWWGKCLRKGYMRQAFLRDNLPY
ncbi:uncharacterized protein LOC123718062 isoform X3 [Pieris brassicae]|uniref:Phospholipase A2 n=1 Tax=Pieris brassicae TaxID=7116 RepID=A0A9P0XDR8_PIEBR|nr:uncharacterized protein LOC123718062 isoform X3 [Pieris brassicae]CAH4034537.1 unnamed protein product [Pieris brassicae]